MGIIPNHPFRRLKNLIDDGPFWRKRWVPRVLDHLVINTSLQLPRCYECKTKKEDPDWRKNWKWVLLESAGPVEYWPIYFSFIKHGFGMGTLLPIRTRLFVMRIGDRPIELITIDNTGNVYKPEFAFLDESDKPLILGKNEMLLFLSLHGGDATFI
ncbi:hypothetical protein KC865_01760 [Candidatus Kaiserbacteria bacterium]|nr:hypothetical protein [Candidatus Kaiserbacteria bacterium]USN91987.1 MAG: hypothetical protein H6782_03875 [Candidatus Nomurabacteria bacterium]